MNYQLIGFIFACIAVVTTIVWCVLAARGLRTLTDIRDELRRRRDAESSSGE